MKKEITTNYTMPMATPSHSIQDGVERGKNINQAVLHLTFANHMKTYDHVNTLHGPWKDPYI